MHHKKTLIVKYSQTNTINYTKNNKLLILSTCGVNSSDWVMSADARSITVSKAVMDAKGANWYGNDTDHQLKLTTVSGATTVTPTIITGAPLFTGLTGITGNNYKRDTDTLVINGADLIGATHVTLVESNGSIAPSSLQAYSSHASISLPYVLALYLTFAQFWL